MFARLSVDTDLVRAYGAASSTHAAALKAAASRLTSAGAGADMLGPVGARFVAVLRRAAEDEARVVAALSGALAAARDAASESAQAYEGTDTEAAGRIAF
jgi:hypothetical protein